MTHIKVDYQPSSWKVIWIFPQAENSPFKKIQIWDWEYNFEV